MIEEAAASLGQSVSDFAVSTLVHQARSVIEQRNVTTLSDRDRDHLFLSTQVIRKLDLPPLLAMRGDPALAASETPHKAESSR